MTEESETYNPNTKKSPNHDYEEITLEQLLERRGLSLNSLAGAIAYLSGERTSSNRFYRLLRKGGDFGSLSLTPSQWIALARATGYTDQELLEMFNSEYERRKRED